MHTHARPVQVDAMRRLRSKSLLIGSLKRELQTLQATAGTVLLENDSTPPPTNDTCNHKPHPPQPKQQPGELGSSVPHRVKNDGEMVHKHKGQHQQEVAALSS